MVGLVIISHSRKLAEAVSELARGVSGTSIPMAYVGGTGSNRNELGTATSDIIDAIKSIYTPDGVLVLMDLGSAVLSAKLAQEMLKDDCPKVILSPAPLVEGAVYAAVQIAAGATLEEALFETKSSLASKENDIDSNDEEPTNTQNMTGALTYRFQISDPHGLHARPAAKLVNTVYPFKATVKIANITKHKASVNAKSLNNIAISNIAQGDIVEISALGEDAAELIEAVKALVETSYTIQRPPEAIQKLIVLSHGFAEGTLCLTDESATGVAPEHIDDPEMEIKKLEEAVKAVQADIAISKARLLNQGLVEEAAIFDAHHFIAQDEDLLADVMLAIRSEQLSAAYLYQRKAAETAAHFKELASEYMQERALDLGDVARQIVAKLTGKRTQERFEVDDMILCADEITPSLLGRYDTEKIKGLLTFKGGRFSHVAIIAKALSIPALANYIKPAEARNGMKVIIDTKSPEVLIDPPQKKLTALRTLQSKWTEEREADLNDSSGKAITKDGVYIPVYANVGDIITARSAIKNGAEGIGLLRSEFLHINRKTVPTEDFQISIFREIFKQFGQMPVTVRTLDIGGDKDIAWLNLPKEENPFLGVRGIRLCMREKDFFKTQLRAILRAGKGHSISIMIPMVSVAQEIEFTKDLLKKSHEELEKEGIEHAWPVRFGIMMETPAAAIQADSLAGMVDFFSIGTNDLIQYVMSAERGSAETDSLQNPFQPAVLQCIRQIVDAAHRHKIEVSVCGEAAGNLLTAKMLLGLGVTHLSMNGSAIGKIKKMIRDLTLSEVRKIATKALNSSDPHEAEALFK